MKKKVNKKTDVDKLGKEIINHFKSSVSENRNEEKIDTDKEKRKKARRRNRRLNKKDFDISQ